MASIKNVIVVGDKMVTLRYHIATIIAVFLSLGVGILLGAGTGQQWLYEKEQLLLERLELKYEDAMKSNRMLQQQLQELTSKIEASNQDFISLVTNNYSPELKDQTIALWYSDGIDGGKVKEILTQVGMQVKVTAEGWQETRAPLLVVGPKLPQWINQLPGDAAWLHVPQEPISPLDQWKLLQNISLLVKETEGTDDNNSQNQLHRTGIQ